MPVVRQSEEAVEPCADLAKAKEACLAEVGTTPLMAGNKSINLI